MDKTINKIAAILFAVLLIIAAFYLETYMLIFIGACVIVLAITGGNKFTKLFDREFLRDRNKKK